MSNAFDLTVNALREQGLNSDEILDELSKLFKMMECTGKKDAETKDIEEKIKEVLNAIYMPCNIKGYDCWVQAIRIHKERGRMILSKELYPEVAKICGITPQAVERAMRNAIEQVFQRCPEEIIASEFKNAVSPEKGKVTNSQFIVIMAEKI